MEIHARNKVLRRFSARQKAFAGRDAHFLLRHLRVAVHILERLRPPFPGRAFDDEIFDITTGIVTAPNDLHAALISVQIDDVNDGLESALGKCDFDIRSVPVDHPPGDDMHRFVAGEKYVRLLPAQLFDHFVQFSVLPREFRDLRLQNFHFGLYLFFFRARKRA